MGFFKSFNILNSFKDAVKGLTNDNKKEKADAFVGVCNDKLEILDRGRERIVQIKNECALFDELLENAHETVAKMSEFCPAWERDLNPDLLSKRFTDAIDQQFYPLFDGLGDKFSEIDAELNNLKLAQKDLLK